jgi:hypothetical protein
MNVEVLAFSKSLAFYKGFLGSREDSLCLLALCSKSTEGTSITGDVDAGLLLKLSDTVIDE